MDEKTQRLVDDFVEYRDESPDFSIGFAVISVITKLINESNATTFMGIDQEIRGLITAIEAKCPDLPLHFRGASQVFLAGMPKTSDTSFLNWKSMFFDHGKHCLRNAKSVLDSIPEYTADFLQHGMTILTRGHDSLVSNSITMAAAAGKHFKVIITEGSPINDGFHMASSLTHPNISVSVIPDSSVGLIMNEVDTVIIGTDLVLEDGGLIAPIGTYAMCALANVHRKPVYCICETFKFTRQFILNNTDMQNFQKKMPYKIEKLDKSVLSLGCKVDYTQARFLTLLITEKGPIPPSAVTHELTKILGVS